MEYWGTCNVLPRESLLQVTCICKSIPRWMHIFKIHMICIYAIYAKYINTLNSDPSYQASKTLFCVRSYQLAKLASYIPLFMHHALSLVYTRHANHAINRRTFAFTLGTHPGGRGRACAPAFFLYYYHPPRNFFCNIAPLGGALLASGYDMGAYPPYIHV